MFNLKTLSDAQAELMQGGWSKGGYMAQCKKPTWGSHGSNGSNGSYGPESITITNISMEVLQVSDSLALSIGGHESFAVSEVDQELDINVEVG
jgi:hypothetical protein